MFEVYELTIDLRNKETQNNMLYITLDINLMLGDDYREMAEKLLDLTKKYIKIME